MASAQIPAPGSKFGPCIIPCQHRDCAESRRVAMQVCPLCQRPIGYGTDYYNDCSNHGYGLVHALCLETEIERSQGAESSSKA